MKAITFLSDRIAVDDAIERQRLLTRALGLVRLEDPDLLSTPHGRLDVLQSGPVIPLRRVREASDEPPPAAA